MPITAYRIRSRWRVRGTIDEVACVFEDAESWARWWPAAFLDVRAIAADRDRTSQVARIHSKGWLPYTMRLEASVDRCEYPHACRFRVRGDFEGFCDCSIRQAGEDVLLAFDWQVTVHKPLLRALSRVLRPVLVANHRWVMRQGERSLALELARRDAIRTGRAFAWTPPGPTFRFRRHLARHARIGLLVALGTLSGCSAGALTTRAALRFGANAEAALRDEPDFELARAASYANLNAAEALRRDLPDDAEAELRLARGYGSAALLFAEDDALRARCNPGLAPWPEPAARVGDLYRRAARHALRSLGAGRSELRATLQLRGQPLIASLAESARPGDAPALLWLAVGWLGGAVAESPVDAIAVGRARALLARVVELDGDLEHGAAWLLLGQIDAQAPAATSVSADRGAAYFDRALAVSGGRLLLAKVERARAVYLRDGARERFESDLREVLAAPADILPGERLLTTVAKRRAAQLLAVPDTRLREGAGDVHYRLPCP